MRLFIWTSYLRVFAGSFVQTPLFIVLCCFLPNVIAFSQDATPTKVLTHPFYVGAGVGYGSTTWDGLVPAPLNLNPAIALSVPISASEGGVAWGLLAGYEFGPHFALEANYMRYPSAVVFFDEISFFALEQDGALELHTDTDTFSLMAKILLPIPRTPFRFYSSFGVAEIHRWDIQSDIHRDSPTFGLGFVCDISEHIMAELSANYTAGYGESEVNPVKDYVPFLYSGLFKLAYRV